MEDKEWSYRYDAEGNPVQKTSKTQPAGRFSLIVDEVGFLTWTYVWNANGSLQSAFNNEGVCLSFEYDALGRRTAKINHQTKKIKRFLWDGNVPLHEWEYPLSERPELISDKDGILTYKTPEPTEDITTWIFEEDSFVPVAKLQNGERFSIFADHLGTPVMAVDGEGKKVWSRELDIYGKTRTETGKSNFIPFRMQGMYFDEETELCYVRYRYYSEDTGTFISQDPIGLEGGMPNMYAYVHDSNTWIDPLGLMAGINFSKIAPIDLGEGFRARKDVFNYKGEANFEVHVYKIKGKKLEEVGIMNSKGDFFSKHGLSGQAPNLPESVSKKLKNMCKS